LKPSVPAACTILGRHRRHRHREVVVARIKNSSNPVSNPNANFAGEREYSNPKVLIRVFLKMSKDSDSAELKFLGFVPPLPGGREGRRNNSAMCTSCYTDWAAAAAKGRTDGDGGRRGHLLLPLARPNALQRCQMAKNDGHIW
jgi:hypothetical protein